MSRILLAAFVILCFAGAFGAAQTASKKAVPNGLALKIVYFKGKSPAYISVPDATAKEGAWFALFQRIPNWQPSADALPVRAVNIISRVEGNAVKVSVSVFTGLKLHEREEFVADYLIGKNETVEVKELLKFGVAPFEISVVAVTPSVTVLPSVDNKTVSLEVVSVEPNYSTLPSYKIKFLNNSSKAVSAFTFETLSNNISRISSMPHNLDGETLIKPGEVFEKIISKALGLEKNSDAQIPAIVPNEVFRINAVIFEDGTFEGDVKDAAQFLAFQFGDASQLRQIVPLLHKADAGDFRNGELSRQISNLGVGIDQIALVEFLKGFPTLSDREKSAFRGSAEIASQATKTVILKELKAFEANQNKVEIEDGIKAMREKYQNRLARLL